MTSPAGAGVPVAGLINVVSSPPWLACQDRARSTEAGPLSVLTMREKGTLFTFELT
jgi:hypothetical protein